MISTSIDDDGKRVTRISPQGKKLPKTWEDLKAMEDRPINEVFGIETRKPKGKSKDGDNPPTAPTQK